MGQKKKLLTLFGLSLTESSGLFDLDVPLHSGDVPVLVITAEAKDWGPLSGTFPGRK